MLTGCASFGGDDGLVSTSVTAEIPADIRACFLASVPPPPDGELTQGQIFWLVAELKASETAKNACGNRLIAWVEGII